MAFAVLVIAITMVTTGIGLTFLFQRHIERRVGQELDAHLEQIIGGIRFDKEGTAKLSRDLADPRFGKVFGGLYFQVRALTGETLLKSRSLWDTQLDLPKDTLALGQVHIHSRPGPNNATLLIHESRVVFSDRGVERPLVITVGIDNVEILNQRGGFARDLVPALSALAFVLLIGFGFQIAMGIRPLDRLRQNVADVRSGRISRLKGNAPSEVTPLIEEVNTLLDQQEESMVRARDRAADLAHGLKTPLTALASDIEKLHKIGAHDIAHDIQELSLRMRRHLDRELASARDRHGRANARTFAMPPIDSIMRTLEKTPNGEGLIFYNNVADWIEVAVELGDFLEIVGNLLENATKFATKSVLVDCDVSDDWALIIVNDDGPGVDEAKVSHITKRGVRLDTAGPGSGLGLAIVKDIVSTYGGQLILKNRTDHGLSVTVKLPIFME